MFAFGAALLLLFAALPAEAAPQFAGLEEARPAPGAAVLHWERATGSTGTVSYRIYRKRRSGWNLRRPDAEIHGTDWVILGLPPGKPQEFLVRARDKTGEEQNRKTLTVTPTGKQPAAEWRGVWMTRFEWPQGSRQEIEQRLRTAMASLSAGNFNAVILQVRGQGDTLYPSTTEPWSPILSQSARGFDPVAFALAEAEKQGLELHAWMNLSTIWQSSGKELPANANHPARKFADARRAATRTGLIHDEQGKPVQWGADDYVWLTPGNPRVNAYLRRQVLEFIERYDVDGLHWDDRTGNPNGPSRDPVSLRRFMGSGNPMQTKDFGKWQRHQLTRMLRRIYVQAKARRPDLLISAAPFGIADRQRIPGYGAFSDAKGFGVTPEQWLRHGVVDVLMPQIYWNMPDPEPNYGTLVRDWLAHNRTNRPIWPGSALGNFGGTQPLVPTQKRYVAFCRAHGVQGMTFFSWSQASPAQWRHHGRQLFPAKARVPAPPNEKAGTGQLMGWIHGSNGQPLADAWIRIKGRKYVYLTSSDGFFGIPHLQPGPYTLQFRSPGGQRLDQKAHIQANQTTSMKVRM